MFKDYFSFSSINKFWKGMKSPGLCPHRGKISGMFCLSAAPWRDWTVSVKLKGYRKLDPFIWLSKASSEER